MCCESESESQQTERSHKIRAMIRDALFERTEQASPILWSVIDLCETKKNEPAHSSINPYYFSVEEDKKSSRSTIQWTMTNAATTISSTGGPNENERPLLESAWNDLTVSEVNDDLSSGDSEEEDDGSNDDDESIGSVVDEDGETSFFAEVKENCGQHLVAIFVAIVATFLAHSHIMTQQFSVNNPPAPSPEEMHPHLVEFERTSNISFCSKLPRLPLQRNGLQVISFDVPKELAPALAVHYAADVLQDDRYEQVLSVDVQASQLLVEETLQDHAQYKCILSQLETSPVVKGNAYFFSSPPIQSMYIDHLKKAETSVKQKAAKVSPVYLTFTGFAIKFVNLSRKPVMLYWEGKNRQLVGEIAPYDSIGTASTSAGQTFTVTPVDDPDYRLEQWIVTVDDQVIYYDPRRIEERSPWEEQRYMMHQLNKKYAFEYSVVAGRPWLAHFPRPLPVHEMWPASHFGQTHQFISQGKLYDMNVVSVTPRVFEIEKFLTIEECNTLMTMAIEEGLKPSLVQSGHTRARQQLDRSTRSSTNVWVPRNSNDLVDRIYRRAADLLKMDEALLQQKPGEFLHEHEHSIAESLQVVRYKKTEEYTAHHDFVYPPTFHRHQPTRFATILFYLNDKYDGGETVFPRAVNAKNHEGVEVEPKKGKAVLFYNMLPDGNLDDLSQHASRPVTEGAKCTYIRESFSSTLYLVSSNTLSFVEQGWRICGYGIHISISQR